MTSKNVGLTLKIYININMKDNLVLYLHKGYAVTKTIERERVTLSMRQNLQQEKKINAVVV